MGAGAITGAISGIKESYTGYQAGKASKKAGKKAARFILEEARVQAEQMRKQADMMEGETKALAAGSGVMADSGTPKTYLEEMMTANQDAIDWTLKSAFSRALQAKRSGAKAASIAKSTGRTAAMTSFGNAYDSGYKFGASEGWWGAQKPADSSTVKAADTNQVGVQTK